MRKFFTVILGLILLAAAAAILWVARGPQPTEARTTGGILYTQAEVATQTASMAPLSAVTDTQSGALNVPVSPELSMETAQDLQSLDDAEMRDAPQTVLEVESAPEVTASTALTTDIVLGADTGVAVTPLTGDATVSGLDGQGGQLLSTTGYEQRVVELEWPRQFRVGRSGVVRITLKMLENGTLQPVAEIADNEVLATPILITDRYATHNAFVTATIAAPDFTVEWVTPATQPLAKGDPVEWRWTLESGSAQSSVIALGLNISWEAKPGNPPGPQNVPIWGQAVQVDVNYVFGTITVPQASIVSTVLGVLGAIAQYPLLEKVLEITLDVLFGRERRRQRPRTTRNRRGDSDRRNRRY